MTVTISGTNGVTTPEITVDNTAADGGQVVLKSSGYSNWNLDNYSGRLRAYYGGTEYFTVNSSGNVGIGVTPSAWGSSVKVMELGGAVNKGNFVAGGTNFNGVFFGNNAYYNGTNWVYASTNRAGYYQVANGDHQWYNSPSGTAGNAITFTQAMTLDSSGNLLVGTTNIWSGSGKTVVAQSGAAWARATNHTNATTQYFDVFGYNGTAIGQITGNNTSVAYVTSSDYRLKENIQPMTNALSVVSQLNPVTYNWKADGSDGQGFIAHELQAVVPDCVTGEKDAVDAEGKPVFQGIDTSFLVATLTKAIQEQQEQIELMKQEIASLKGAA